MIYLIIIHTMMKPMQSRAPVTWGSGVGAHSFDSRLSLGDSAQALGVVLTTRWRYNEPIKRWRGQTESDTSAEMEPEKT